ncbi:MAG TPA: hypothetical protein PKD12_03730 [Nitrospira sp.]|nr:hypothetical protein [Nitrospira sp.]
MRHRVIQKHDHHYPIRLMCRVLAVSPARYCAGRDRPENQGAVANRRLLTTIRVMPQESRETCGSPRIWVTLVIQGHRIAGIVSLDWIGQDGIRAKTVKKWWATIGPSHPFLVAANMLDR